MESDDTQRLATEGRIDNVNGVWPKTIINIGGLHNVDQVNYERKMQATGLGW